MTMRLLMVALTVLVLAWAQETPKATFDVASIKPITPDQPSPGLGFRNLPGGKFEARFSVKQLVAVAHGIREDQVLGGPGWSSTDLFEVKASIVDGPAVFNLRIATPYLLNLLKERFGLRTHRETKIADLYVLSVSSEGIKIQPSTADASAERYSYPLGGLDANRISMEQLAYFLETQLEQPVVDRTYLTERYNVHFRWKPTRLALLSDSEVRALGADLDSLPLAAALKDQLGLVLERRKGEGRKEVVVIDSVARPTPN